MSEMPEAFRTACRKARKSHACCECGDKIQEGDQYQYSSGVWNGEPASYKQCLNCHEIMKGASIADGNHGGDGVGFGDLKNWFYGWMCIDFKGEEFLKGMAEDCGIDPVKLNKLLKIEDCS